MPYSTEHKQETRTRIIQSARRLFNRNGFADVSIDDIMGELDAKRRGGFLPLLQRAQQSSGQVFMTATAENWPEEPGRELQHWCVKDGTLVKESN